MEGPSWTAPDRSFTKIVIKEGKGLARPNEGSTCQTKIEVNNETVTADGLFGYQTGQETSIILGDGKGEMSGIVDAVLETMREEEICRVEIASDVIKEVMMKGQTLSDTDDSSSGDMEVAANCCLEIHLMKFRRSKDVHELSFKHRVEKMRNYKTFGSECFKTGKTNLAEKFYIRALKYAIISSEFIEEDELPEVVEKFWDLNNLCLLNLSACQLKNKGYQQVIANCTKAIVIDQSNPKGYFRRGQAHVALQDYELALEDFRSGLKLEPNSKPLQEQVKIVQGKMKKLKQGYAKSMKKLFE